MYLPYIFSIDVVCAMQHLQLACQGYLLSVQDSTLNEYTVTWKEQVVRSKFVYFVLAILPVLLCRRNFTSVLNKVLIN